MAQFEARRVTAGPHLFTLHIGRIGGHQALGAPALEGAVLEAEMHDLGRPRDLGGLGGRRFDGRVRAGGRLIACAGRKQDDKQKRNDSCHGFELSL
jgi:hypothetical protein